MRNRRVICGLNESPSQIKKKLKSLKTRGHMDIDEMLFVASKKINPIIEMLVETPNSTEHFLTIKESNDIEDISSIIKDLAKALEHIGFQTNIAIRNLDMSQYKKKVNSEGYFYVDTTLLLQILELYNTLECISNDVDAFYRSLGIHCFVQTETSFVSLRSSDSINPNKIVFKLKKPTTKDASSFSLFQQEFFVMPSSTQIVPLNETTSEILSNSSRENVARKVKSTSSLENEATLEVTDVYGARKVLVKCIYDLQGVDDYLSIPRKDASTICSRAEIDVSAPGTGSRDTSPEQEGKSTGPSGKKTRGSIIVDKSGKQIEHDPEKKEKCCCPECFAHTQGPGTECEDDQVIICIKGCNEDDGDVQIVIRQCPDCKKAKDSPESPAKASAPTPPSDRKSPPPPAIPVESKPKINPTKNTSIKKNFVEAPPSSESTAAAEPQTDEDAAKKIESTILHNKDSKGSVICSDEEDEDKPKKQDPMYVQNQVSCSRIHLFETTNLCLQTEAGQELVISLTVTPKDLSNLPKRISLTDIFSDSEYAPLDIKKSSADQKSETSSRKSIISQGSGRKSGNVKQTVTYAVPERYIPLGRTKICSSLDFDVTTAESKIREKGIKNKNNKIVVQLQEFGTDNLLRACRPAKCCRKAILNEKMKKCLPYAPSIQSLPLGDSDMQVINESLEMSLQKVKNSMNLKKDYYKNNQVYFMNPIHTVMYFFIDENLSKKYENSLVKQKLGYYINLVNDIEPTPKAKYEIMYFGVESKLSKNQVNQSAKTCSSGSEDKVLDVEIAEVVSNPWKWIKQKYNKYEEKPMMITGHQGFLMKRDSLLTIDNVLSKTGRQTASSNVFKQRITQKKSNISRIPIYQRPKQSSFNCHKNLYDLSVGTLPQTQEQLIMVLPSEINSFEKEKNEFTQITHNITNLACDESSKCSRSSKCSMTSTIKRSKRKKKEFYLSRSRSDISLNTLKRTSRNKNVAPLPKVAINQKPSKEISLKKLSQNVCETNHATGDQDSSKIILNYFTQILYEMIMKQMLKDKQNNELSENKNHLMTIGVGTENRSILELYRKPLNHKRSLANHIKSIKEHSYNTLRSKQSQYCIIPGSTKNICILNNLALQTSRIISDNKKIQTSATLLTYLLSQNQNVHLENHYCTYNSGESCEEIEKFIITFGSEHSFSSNFSERDFVCSHSCCCSSRVMEGDQRETLSQSLLKLKETLEKYENVKNEIAQKSLPEANINPIEYFVYQVCACNNKVNKKPSVMQKILSKTKGLFSSVEKDMCRKFKNQREFLSMPQSEREKLCHNCGCIIAKCGEATSLKKPASPTLLLECECPEDNKSKEQKASKQKPAAFNFSKIASASASSIQSIKSCIKNSLSDFKNRTKGKNLDDYRCDTTEEIKEKKEKKGKKPIDSICVSENMSVVKCDKKSTSTGTTQDASTQKCECGKCVNFAADGTCCCSHCLGCLDKSFDTKPDNNSVGIVTDSKSKSAVETTHGDQPIKNGSPINTQSLKDNNGSSNNNNQSSSISQTGDTEANETPAVVNQAANVTPDIEDEAANVAPTSEDQAAVENDAAASNESDEVAQGNDIETIDKNDENTANDSAAYFFVTPPPHMFQNFRLNSRNPFEQYLFSFPHMDMFHLGKSDGVVDK